METKKCSKCGQEKPASAFYKSAKSKDGLQSYCRECQGEERKAAPKKTGGGHSRDKQTSHQGRKQPAISIYSARINARVAQARL